MPPQKMIRKLVISLSFFYFGISAFAAGELNSFRTPAKLYGSAYSVKILLKRKGFDYLVPVWVKPDQKESTLDQSLLLDLGWVYPDLKADSVSLSGARIDIVRFKNLKSDWFVSDHFGKSCCHGVIGQDILKDFVVRFDPNSPVHLEWTRISERELRKTNLTKDFSKKIKALFSVTSAVRRIL